MKNKPVYYNEQGMFVYEKKDRKGLGSIKKTY